MFAKVICINVVVDGSTPERHQRLSSMRLRRLYLSSATACPPDSCTQRQCEALPCSCVITVVDTDAARPASVRVEAPIMRWRQWRGRIDPEGWALCRAHPQKNVTPIPAPPTAITLVVHRADVNRVLGHKVVVDPHWTWRCSIFWRSNKRLP